MNNQRLFAVMKEFSYTFLRHRWKEADQKKGEYNRANFQGKRVGQMENWKKKARKKKKEKLKTMALEWSHLG